MYKFDPSAERPPQPASLATALYILELPRLNASRFIPYIRTYMQFPPSVPTRPDHHGSDGQTVPFGLDPAQTVLVITLLQSTDIDPEFRLGPSEDRYVSERFAIFVPLPTLFARINEAESVARAGTPMSRPPRRTVPWTKWGPAGTRVVRFQYITHISVMGSRCAFMLSDHNTGTLHSVLFDVRPGARGDHSETARARLENLNDDLFDVREVLSENLSFAEEVRTTFPVEVTHKIHRDHWSGFLLQDCVAISVGVLCSSYGAKVHILTVL